MMEVLRQNASAPWHETQGQHASHVVTRHNDTVWGKSSYPPRKEWNVTYAPGAPVIEALQAYPSVKQMRLELSGGIKGDYVKVVAALLQCAHETER
jgi:hypothetical protein